MGVLSANLYIPVKRKGISGLMYNVRMNKDKFIALAGSQTELARILGIHQSAVSQWKTVPQARIWQLMLLRPAWFEK